MAENITKSNFEEKVGDSGVAVVDFWAQWCGPCRMVGPVIEELSKDFEGNDDVMVGKVNVDENPDLAVKYGIRSIPTVVFIKDGEVVERLVGAQAKSAYKDKIDDLL